MLTLCVFLVCLGLASSAPVQKFKFLDLKRFKTIRMGSSIIVDCQTTDASAVVTLWKLKNSKEIQVQPSLNVIQINEIFTIHNIALEDIGLYRCKAKDSLGANISKDVNVILNNFKPGLVLRPSRPVVSVTGSTVTFTCEAVAGTIMWRHVPSYMHKNIPKPSKYTEKIAVNGSISISLLTIPNAQVANSGIYECWLYHYDTTLFRNADLLVKNPKGPFFSNGKSEQKIVKLGESKHLNCEANGFPTPVVSWEKDGKPISLCSIMFLENCEGSNDHYLSQARGMKIEKARFPEDNGTYTCVAKNSFGTSRKDFHIVVEVKPVLDKSKSIAMKNKITCHATEGNPPPKFSWIMQFYWLPGTTVPNENAKWFPISKYRNVEELSPDGMTSVIKVPSMITRAFYRCTAVNPAGKDSHTFRLLRV